MAAALLPLALAALGWAILLASGLEAGFAAYPLAPLLYVLPWIALGPAPGWRAGAAALLVAALSPVVVLAVGQAGLIMGFVLSWLAAGGMAWLMDGPPGNTAWATAIMLLWFGPPALLAGAVLAHIAFAARGWAERAPARAPRGLAACGAIATLAAAYAVTIRLSGATEAPLPFAVLLAGFAPHALLTRRPVTPGPLRLLILAALVVALPMLLLTREGPPAPSPPPLEGGLST